MAEKIAELYVELEARTAKLEAALKQSQTGLNKFKGGLKDVVQGLTGFDIATIGTAAAVGALAAGVKFAVTQAMEAERAMALTASTIKATGGAAGLTATQVSDMAGNLSLMTGVQDDVIQAGQNMLLTFKNIKGEANFERTTQALTDMAVSMNGGSLAGLDLKSSAIQLGKALNDPIAGITALTRVGVTFSQAQKDAIRQMVEMNDIAGAQALILAELESEFGGAAEAAGATAEGQFAKFKNAVSELAEELGTGLLPPLTAVVEHLTWIVNANEQADASFEALSAEIADAAQTYDIYIERMLQAAVQSGKLTHSEAAHIRAVQNGERTHETAIYHADEYLKKLNLMTPAQHRFGVEAHVAGWKVMEVAHAAAETARALAVSATATSDAAAGYARMGEAANAGATDAVAAIEKIQAAEAELANSAHQQSISAGLSGGITTAWEEYQAVLAETGPQMDDLRAEIARMNDAHGQTWEVVNEAQHSVDEYRLAQIEAAKASKKFSETSQENEEDWLRAKIAADNAAASVAQMGTEMGLTEVFTANYTAKLLEANASLSELEAMQMAAEEALRRSTAEFIYQQLAIEGDAEANLQLARNLGILDEASYQTAEAARLLKEQHIATGQSAADYGVEAGKLADAIARLQNKDIEITVTTIRREINLMNQQASEAAWGGYGETDTPSVTGVGQAAGGPTSMFGSGPRWVGENGPEIWVPPMGGGYILNNQDAMAAVGGGGGHTFIIDARGSQMTAGQFEAVVRKVLNAEGGRADRRRRTGNN